MTLATVVTHFIVLVLGAVAGIAFALWFGHDKLDSISKILNHTPRG